MSQNALVTLPTFYLDATEVTVAAYTDCVRAGRCTGGAPPERPPTSTSPPPDAACNAGVPGQENHPMNCVSWIEANAYCRANGKRLPTDSEWDWASRSAMRSGPDQHPALGVTPWEGVKPDFQPCWSGVLKRNGTCPVATQPAGDPPGGIHDLTGNVEEWTSADPEVPDDVWSFFRTAPPKAEPMDSPKFAYGGDWGDVHWDDTQRHVWEPSARYAFLGFRCAASAPGR